MNGVKKSELYCIMHMEMKVASVSSDGMASIFNENFMPYDLYLEETDATDIDCRINNLENFYHWCASRVLSLDREYAKEIMNSIGVSQAATDRDRAKIAMSYHCVSLTDVFWVRLDGEAVTFAELNLYDNPLSEAVVDISLRGRQMTVTSRELAPDLSTKGCFAKAWIRGNSGFCLIKDGGEDIVKKELLASEICQCFDIPQVIYRAGIYDGQPVTKCEIITSKQYSIITKLSFDVYAGNHDIDALDFCRKLDPINYYGMNIIDYLTGNTDRHPENWGFIVDNSTNRCVSLYPLMDFNQCFKAYDNVDGANCLTVYPNKQTQFEAAVDAVKAIGLRQIKDIDMSLFGDFTRKAQMFTKRLALLKNINL